MTAVGEGTGIIRVLVVDDHDLFRAGLASLLDESPDIEVVGQASGGRTAVRLAGELKPDVVLMDLRMPDTDGSSATRQILARQPGMRVVALSVSDADADVTEILAAGACGFVAKDTPVDGVLMAVRAAAQGVAWLSPRAAEVALGHVRRSAEGDQLGHGLEQLSGRELDVLRLLAQGLENPAIARALGISPRTVKNHVSSILAKLGQPSRVHAAVYAVRRGVA